MFGGQSQPGMERDPQLTGVPDLLGPQARAALAPALAAAGGRLEHVRPTQVRYDPGRRLVLRFAADITWADGTRRRDTLGALVDRDGLPAGVAVVAGPSGEQVGVWRYPHDPFLPGLPHAAYPEGARRVLARLGLRAEHIRVEPLVYRPGSRAVIRVATGSGDTVYLKVLRPDAVASLLAAHGQLAGQVRIPRPLGWSEPLGLVALEGLPGRTLARPLVDGDGTLPPPTDVLGLAARLAPARLARPAAAAEAVLSPHVRLLRAVLPSAADRAETVASVAAATPRTAEQTIHGDFYEAQLLVDGGGALVGLLDVEGARRGAPHEDPATLVAHLAALAHVHRSAAPRINNYLRAVLACLAGTHELPLVRAAAAGVLLGIATTPFRRQEADWPTRTNAWLELAAAWAAGRAAVAA
jgi:hypothetical protein